MQITERSIVGLRSARITLAAPGKPEFTLFPMIHVADAEFFAQVHGDAAGHDLVLTEGVRARPARIAGRSYRLAAGGAMSLAHQNDHMQSKDFRRCELADMDGATFMGRWRKLPLWLRLAFPLVLPVAYLILRFRGSRKWLAEALGSLNDNDRPGDIMPGDGALGELRDLLLNQRDAVLAKRCDAAIAARDSETIAVIYGAAHMPALIRHLRGEHGYAVARSEWMTAIAA